MDRPLTIREILQKSQEDVAMMKGEAKGFLRGKIQTTQYLLWLLIVSRFGDIPTVLLDYIYYVRDPERLENAFRQALTMEKLEDLRI